MSSPARDKARKTSPRVVLDTGVLLRALLLGDSRAQGLRQAWQQGRYIPLIDGIGAQALMRSLACPALQLNEDQRHEVLADFLPYAQVVPGSPAPAGRRSAQPAGDLALARPARADLLVSDCPVLKMNFARRVSRSGKPACRLLGSEEFFALHGR